MYCNLNFTVREPSEYGGSLILKSVVYNGISFEPEAETSLLNLTQTVAFLNKLSIGKWSGQATGVDKVYSLADFDTSKTLVITGLNATDQDVIIDQETSNCRSTLTDNTTCQSCFTGIVAMRDVCEPENAKSCIYLDDIGFNKKKITDLLTEDYSSEEDFITKCTTTAIREVIDGVYSYKAAQIRLNNVINNGVAGYLNTNLSIKSSEGGKVGLLINIANINGYVDLLLKSIYLNVNYTGDIDVEIWDAMRNRLIDTVAVSCVPQAKNAVSLESVITSIQELTQIALIYDSTGIDSYTTTVKNGLCCGKTSMSNEWFTLTGVQIDAGADVLDKNLKKKSHTSGMMVEYGVECNHEKWLCSFVAPLKPAILYKTAEVITRMGLLKAKPQRVNNTVSTFGELQEKELAFYQSMFSEHFTNALRNITIPNDKKCFVCNSNITIYNNPTA